MRPMQLAIILYVLGMVLVGSGAFFRFLNYPFAHAILTAGLASEVLGILVTIYGLYKGRKTL